MTDTDSLPAPLAAFAGVVTCRQTDSVLTLTGAAADSADGILILTLIAPALPAMPAFPDRLSAATVRALGERRYGIASASQNWVVEAASIHVHRDIGEVFYRAVPPRPAPLSKRLFWRVVLALAGTRPGKRLLLSLRRRA